MIQQRNTVHCVCLCICILLQSLFALYCCQQWCSSSQNSIAVCFYLYGHNWNKWATHCRPKKTSKCPPGLSPAWSVSVWTGSVHSFLCQHYPATKSHIHLWKASTCATERFMEIKKVMMKEAEISSVVIHKVCLSVRVCVTCGGLLWLLVTEKL